LVSWCARRSGRPERSERNRKVEHTVDKAWRRQRSKFRIRKRLGGSAERPRVVVYRSLNHIYAQAVDDVKGSTVATASSRDKGCRERVKQGGNIAAAKIVGEEIAKRLKEKGFEQVVFDRGGYRYHGRIRVLAEAAREQGLKF
jgi:large subunit ribosomal protein L18